MTSWLIVEVLLAFPELESSYYMEMQFCGNLLILFVDHGTLLPRYTLACWSLNVSWFVWQLCVTCAYNFVELTSCIEKPWLCYGIDL